MNDADLSNALTSYYLAKLATAQAWEEFKASPPGTRGRPVLLRTWQMAVSTESRWAAAIADEMIDRRPGIEGRAEQAAGAAQ